MGRLARITVALGLAVLMFFTGTGVALAATVAATGMITVRVQEPGPAGTRFHVPVPAVLVDLGLGVAELAMPPEELARLRAEVEPYAPLIRGIARELERLPDATLVDVTTDTESVQVVKRRRAFLVEVDAEGTHVRVVVPARTFGRVAAFLT